MGILKRPMFPADEMPPAAPPGVLAAAIAPKKPGFFDGGGTGSKIGSFLLEALTGIPSGAHREQRQERDLDMFQRKGLLAQQLEDLQWQRREQYKRDHPEIRPPHYWETNNGSLGMVDPMTGQPSILYQDPTPKVDWLQVKDPATGAVSLVPRPQGVAPAAPMKPVGKLTPIAPGGAGSGPRTFP